MTATGIHLTDLATALLGKPRDLRVSCESLSSKIPQGDTTSVHIRFRSGGTAYVSASLAMPFVSRFAVYGSRGRIDIHDKDTARAAAGGHNAAGLDLGQHVIRRRRGCCRPRGSTKN